MLSVGSKINYSGLEDLVVTELVDHFPEEVANLKRIVGGEPETDPTILLAHLINDFSEIASDVRARGAVPRDERRTIAVDTVAKFPDEVAVVQAKILARAPKQIAALTAGAIARFKNGEHCLKCRVTDLNETGDSWTLPGTLRYPVVGEGVSHDSEEGLSIESIDGLIATFSFDKRDVSCRVEDLVWLNEDDAWYLPGRLLSQADRHRWRAITGSPFPPPPDKHVEARNLLRSTK